MAFTAKEAFDERPASPFIHYFCSSVYDFRLVSSVGLGSVGGG